MAKSKSKKTKKSKIAKEFELMERTMVAQFEEVEKMVAKVDLVKLSKAVMGIISEFQKMSKNGQFDEAIKKTITVHGTIFQNLTVNILEMYKEASKVIVPRMGNIVEMLDNTEYDTESLKDIWKKELMKNPKSALKILEYKEKIMKAFNS